MSEDFYTSAARKVLKNVDIADREAGVIRIYITALDDILREECDAEVGHDGLETACRIRERVRTHLLALTGDLL